MSVELSLQSLIDETRSMSGLGSNDFFDDTDIVGFLQDGLDELDDNFTAANRHWRSKSYHFEITSESNSIDLATEVPDYQVTQGVDNLANPKHPRNVNRLGSFADRNKVTSTHYFEDGGNLVMYGRNPVGCYVVHYTPQSIQLALRESQTFDIGDSAVMLGHERIIDINTDLDTGCDSTDQPDHIDGPNATIYLTNGSFGDDDIGVQITINTNVQTVARTVTTIVSPSVVIVDSPLADDPLNDSGDEITIADVSNLSFPNAAFVDDQIGGTLDIGFTNTLDLGANGEYFIYVLSPTDVQIRLTSFSAFHNPTAGSITVGWQPPDTVDELPVMMRQWAVYLKLYASITIREGQDLDTSALERKINALRVRIKSMAHKRSDGIIQPPVQNHYRPYRWLGHSD
jgi:hypothetical protein